MKDQLKIPKQLFRTGTFETGADGTMRLSVSSDIPYERYDWVTGERYYEVLDHSPGGVDLSRLNDGAALLYNHNRDMLLGTLNKPECAGGRCYVNARMSAAPDVESYRIKVSEGILKDCSIGYAITSDGEKIGKKDGLPIYKFRFAINEASLVTVAADPTVGVGRSREFKPQGQPDLIAIQLQKEIDTGEEKGETPIMKLQPLQKFLDKADEQGGGGDGKIDVVRERSDAVVAERKRVADIQELATHFREKGLGGRRIETNICAADCIANGDSVDDFQKKVVRGTFEEIKNNVERVAGEGMPEKDISRYSVLRAMRILSVKNNSGLDGLEGEMSREAAKNLGIANTPTSFFIPFDVMRAPAPGTRGAALSRALATNVFSAAGALVGTDLLGGSMIELLRNKMKVLAMGARILSGLVGNIDIPKQTGGATASWLSEGSTVSASNQTVGQLQLTPHRLSANTAFTNQLLTQSSVDVENFVRQDLMTVLALARDLAAIAGTGAAGQPLGILSTTGLATSVTFANAQTMLYSDALIFENNVALQNADEGALGYMTTPTVRKNAKAIAEISAANSNPVWKDNRVNGYNAQATNQVPTATSVIFGNWNDLILADWAANQVIVDPYTQADVDQVRIIMRIFADNGLRHPTSFSVSTN